MVCQSPLRMKSESTNSPSPTFPTTDTPAARQENTQQTVDRSQLGRKSFHFCFFLRLIFSFSGKSTRGNSLTGCSTGALHVAYLTLVMKLQELAGKPEDLRREIFYFRARPCFRIIFHKIFSSWLLKIRLIQVSL